MAKQIPLYMGYKCEPSNHFAIVDDSDYEFLNQWKWYLMKLYHCDSPIVYARRYEVRKEPNQERKIVAILMHRAIMNLSSRADKCDHKDGNGLNNQKENLRVCTHAENMSNRKRTKASSGYIGVMLVKKTNRWSAGIRHNGEKIYLGSFVNKEGAALEYNRAALKLKGEFAAQNIIHV